MKTIIDSSVKKTIPDFKELFRYKDLFYTLTWRDFRVRYAQTTIGFLWAFLQPVISLLLISFIFRGIVGVETEVPHLLFTITGLGIWTYFSFVMVISGDSIIASQNMVKKIYFPRLIIPLSKAVVGFIEFGISLLLMVVLMIYYGVAPSGNMWFAPLFILIGIMAALSIGIWLSALTVRYRDFKHIVPFIVQIGYFVTPIGYPVELVSNRFPNWVQAVYYLNPMAGVVQGFRWSVFGGEAPGNLIYISIGIVLLMFISGIAYFSRVEDKMADYV